MLFEEYTAQNLNQAKNGDAQIRDELLARAKPFIQSACTKYCNRMLEWGRDEELSVGLLAFNEAIDRFDEERKIPFLGFARLVIKSRLADYFRREVRHQHQPLEYQVSDQAPIQLETAQAWENYILEAERQERQEEVLEFQRELAQYGIGIGELVDASPKHRDSREGLLNVAQQVVENAELMAHLNRTKRLPIKELALGSGLHRKTIEKGRRYIIAMALLLQQRDRFIYLFSYLKLTGWSDGEGGMKHG